MSSYQAREELVAILERELLGPLNGPDEVLGGQPDVVYLAGRIAPRKLTGEEVPDDEAGEHPDDDGEPDGDDDSTDDAPQRQGLMVPASMGLRCQIPDDLDEFTVTASWGVYEPITEEADGKRLRRYQRTPVAVTKTITVADLKTDDTTRIQLKDEVLLQVDQHDDQARDCRLIELALCNDRETSRPIPVPAWLYQTKLVVSAGGKEVFLPVCDLMLEDLPEEDEELKRINLQYRNRLEFAVGRTCSVDWTVAENARRASEVRTTWLPVAETPQVAAGEVDALLDMKALAIATPDQLRTGLSPIVGRYADWLDGEEATARQLPPHLQEEGLDAVAEARKVHTQLAAGLEHLLTDDEALRCFRFMNKVMADQRVQSQVAQLRASEPALSLDEARDKVLQPGPRAHSWRTFQLAFILMQLPLLTDPAAPKRSGALATAQLLFFPTGGGKTEAYLGLAAYAFAIRRRQGVLDTPDGPLNGNAGLTVLMRYTLRLLTAQQFQRATALICAAEMTRREDTATWGAEPFLIGLWVGTDVSPKRVNEAQEERERANRSHGGYRLTVLQIQRCPWCGSAVNPRDIDINMTKRRVYVYCGDEFAECPFAKGGEAGDGLPVLTTDEEIYRLAPAFLIATVDKFARLAREGEAASLFGYVSRKCDRHGYVHPDYKSCDLKDGSKHPAKNEDKAPAASIRPVSRLRPPDLIIQDELHLITGALGTTTGLFEVAIDTLTSWRTTDGTLAQPLLVASTATARNAHDQVRALYGRGVTVFPPQVLDAGRTFFSQEIPVSETHPGRRYIGVSTTGVRLTTAEIRVAEIAMAAGQRLMDTVGDDADPYMTLTGYFSSRRELGGMSRYMQDDVQTTLAKGRPWSPLPRRFGTDYGDLNIAELTSRVSSADITVTLDRMAASYSEKFDSTAARKERSAARAAGQSVEYRDVNPYDAVLATSMLQVGVDVTRLGLMLVVGQPKNTAEYIQASSRVGRDNDRPGLVITVGNWARPRDLAHFEQFRHYHETFYARVEALSVTPFSVTSLDRGLDGVLVSAARVLQAAVPDGLSPEKNAGRIGAQHDFVASLIDRLVERVTVASDEASAERARQRLVNALDQWTKRRKHLADRQKVLVYERPIDGDHDALMISAENAKAGTGGSDDPPFVVANSMREVQPEINLLVSPIADNLVYVEPLDAPKWEMPS